jgi:hypothetical protein
MKKRLVLGERDICVLNALHLHGALNSRQLAKLCFAEAGFETVRKRLRKLHQAGYLGATVTDNKEEKGRPEHLYFLADLAVSALARSRNMSEKDIAIGPPNTNHKEHLTRLVDLHLAWQRTAKQEKIVESDFITKRASSNTKNDNGHLNEAKGHADVTITFKRSPEDPQSMLLVLETGNLRLDRHWRPKINALLKANKPVLVVALNEKRLATLREWTLPLLKAAEITEERCLFSLYDEIVARGFLYFWDRCTKGSIEQIPV